MKTKLAKSAYSVVSFDIDGTLVDFPSMLGAALTQVGLILGQIGGRTFTSAELQELRNQVAAETAFAGASLESIRRESFRRALEAVGVEPQRHLEALWETFLDSRSPGDYLYPDVRSTLHHLHSRGIRLVAASNGNTPLGDSPLRDYFEALFFAHDLGVSKPDLRFFLGTSRKLDVKPEAVLHVGDSLLEDYLPALASGMGAALLHRSAAKPPSDTLTIGSLAELPGLLNL